MYTVLCYGDSNTWGDPPGGVGRHPWQDRWPGVLQQLLGPEYRIIDEGLCGRTTSMDDPNTPDRNGLSYLSIALETHCPLDLLVFMLGTNDLKSEFNRSAVEIAQGIEKLILCARKYKHVLQQILVVAPPSIVQTKDPTLSACFEGGIAKSREFARYFKEVAQRHGCLFLDGSNFANCSCIDGIHLDRENHHLLANGIFNSGFFNSENLQSNAARK